MASKQGSAEPETCPLCPSTGPPVHPNAKAPNADDASTTEVDLQWVACEKCDTWQHSVCVYLSPEYREATIPQELREEAESSGEHEWYDWPRSVAKWYCKPCVDFSTSPENPRPPRQPLATTLKKRKPKRAPKSASPNAKRKRLSAADEGTPAPSANGDGHAVADTPAPSEGRPKRQAALDRPDYWNMHHHNATPTKGWLDLIKDPRKHKRVIKEDNFPRVPGSLLRKEWIGSDPNAADLAMDVDVKPEFPPTLFYGPSREPLVVTPENGGLESMGGMVPEPSLTVDDVARLVGPHKMVDVIDVATQQSSQWTLAKWAEYVKARNDPNAASSSKVYNIISLEISGTELAKSVRPPRIVSDVDWVENFWPFPGGKEATMRAAAKGDGTAEVTPVKGKAKSEWPKVQLYCLMGMKDSWTDWHVDFAASSVYYSVHTGSKVFFFIRPTEANLAAYTKWSSSQELQQGTWLPDMCDEVRKVTLVAGDTMIIPAGYIHSVFTPVDSIVFGGNFVHSYDIPTQLRLRQIEIDTKVPQRFRFPFFDRLCWYVAERYTTDLRQLRAYRPNSTKPPTVPLPSDRVLRGLLVLARFLIGQVEKMESPLTEDKLRRIIWQRIPAEVTDAGALAHELLWRAEAELPDLWEDEDEVKVTGDLKSRKRKATATSDGNGRQKKGATRAEKDDEGMRLFDRSTPSRTWRFSPSPWAQDEHPIERTTRLVTLPRPGGTEPESAEEVTAVYRQCRRRTRVEDDETVLEEQDLVFTEKRVIWREAAVAANGGTTASPVHEAS